MAKQQLRAFSPSDAEKIAEAVRRVLGSPGRPINAPPGQFIAPPEGIQFINDSGEEMPAGAIGAIKGYVTADNGVVYAEIEKPGTTFRRQYVVNTDIRVVADQGIGFCQFSDSYRIAHDTSWAPATGESGGPKPGSWLLWKGYPALVSVIGRANEADDILLGTLGEITTLLCKATADNAAGVLATDTSDYKIQSGTAGSEADAGFTTQPAIYAREATSNNEFFTATFVNGTWYANIETGRILMYKAKLNGALAATDANATIDNVTCFGGGTAPSPTSAANTLDLAGSDNDDCVVVKDGTGYYLFNVMHHAC